MRFLFNVVKGNISCNYNVSFPGESRIPTVQNFLAVCLFFYVFFSNFLTFQKDGGKGKAAYEIIIRKYAGIRTSIV